MQELVTSEPFEMPGPFAYRRTYGDDTPNPALLVTGLGSIGLPLGTRDAAALVERGKRTNTPGERVFHAENVRSSCYYK